MTSDIGGSNKTRSFFNQIQCGSGHSVSSESTLEVETVTAVDWTDASNPRLLWISAEKGDIWSSDWNGCQSVLELDNWFELKQAGVWPPASFAVDGYHFYWTSVEGRLYKMHRTQQPNALVDKAKDKQSAFESNNAFTGKTNVVAEPVYGVKKIATLATNHQPLPGNTHSNP